jgi:hypothetical protein
MPLVARDRMSLSATPMSRMTTEADQRPRATVARALGGITWRSGRPAVPNDKPYSESLFKTLNIVRHTRFIPRGSRKRSDLGAFTNTSAEVELSIALTLSRK